VKTQSFELKLRVFAKQEFHCPLCRCPLNLDAVFNPPPRMPAAYVSSPAPNGPHARLALWAEQFCVAERISVEDLRARSQVTELVEARRRFCIAARKAHFSTPQIGRWLGRHHTSVLNLLHPKKRPQLVRSRSRAKGAAA